jgi:hypothetical protein
LSVTKLKSVWCTLIWMLSSSSLEWTGRAQVTLPGRLEKHVRLNEVSSTKPAAGPDGLMVMPPPSVHFVDRTRSSRKAVLPRNTNQRGPDTSNKENLCKTFQRFYFESRCVGTGRRLATTAVWWTWWAYKSHNQENKYPRGSRWMRRAKWIAIKGVVWTRANISFPCDYKPLWHHCGAAMVKRYNKNCPSDGTYPPWLVRKRGKDEETLANQTSINTPQRADVVIKSLTYCIDASVIFSVPW